MLVIKEKTWAWKPPVFEICWKPPSFSISVPLFICLIGELPFCYEIFCSDSDRKFASVLEKKESRMVSVKRLFHKVSNDLSLEARYWKKRRKIVAILGHALWLQKQISLLLFPIFAAGASYVQITMFNFCLSVIRFSFPFGLAICLFDRRRDV